MKKIELLSPAGDMECLKAAIQNGADAVYVGLDKFSARASATNFTLEDLKTAIDYAHLRNVKIHLTLNTLLKNQEFDDIIQDIEILYEYGLDAVIVQDFGLAKFLIRHFPKLPVHASTQMTIHNLDGVLEAEKLGFSRIVLSRETSLNDIKYICKHSNIELEAFIHGALCISYSGQCLFSSLIGSRSGNRGRCAGACRLPYELLEDEKVIDKGYLLSPKDMCGLEYIPYLIECGVSSLKIEGRMKNPEYVAIVTRIYRKYIDLFMQDAKSYKISPEDKKALLQVFNRGGFSSGHLDDCNKDLIFKEKPSNIGIYVGHISNYNAKKGHITLTLNETLSIGDSISIEGEDYKYTVSELMKKNQNLPTASLGETVQIGRMKGNIRIGAKIYKITDKNLSNFAKTTYQKENRKLPIDCKIDILNGLPIKIELKGTDVFSDISVSLTSDIIPTKANNMPITQDRIKEQLSKTGNTPFYLSSIKVNMDANLHIASISALNALRRTALDKFSEKILDIQRRTPVDVNIKTPTTLQNKKTVQTKRISLLLNTIDCNFDYSNLKVDRLYIPLTIFTQKCYTKTIEKLTTNFNTYIYLPNIIRNNYKNLVMNSIDTVISKFEIKGFVISNLSQLHMLEHYNSYEFIANYTFNIFNDKTCNELKSFNTLTLSPELNKTELNCINSSVPTELIVYGKLPVMSCHYCFMGNTNKCYPECSTYCKNNHSYYLKDRLNLLFKIVPDNLQTVTTIYNSKITSISSDYLNIDSVRIDILDESPSEIENIISTVKNGNKLTGKNYTNGNINREV